MQNVLRSRAVRPCDACRGPGQAGAECLPFRGKASTLPGGKYYLATPATGVAEPCHWSGRYLSLEWHTSATAVARLHW